MGGSTMTAAEKAVADPLIEQARTDKATGNLFMTNLIIMHTAVAAEIQRRRAAKAAMK